MQGILLTIELHPILFEIDEAFVGIQTRIGAIQLPADDALRRLIQSSLAVGISRLSLRNSPIEASVESPLVAGNNHTSEEKQQTFGFHSKGILNDEIREANDQGDEGWSLAALLC